MQANAACIPVYGLLNLIYTDIRAAYPQEEIII